ncbi:hypothetical protein EDB19DRAFT_1927330 [Suillus lakei]|nr:hypothetical protein EDB19DRAFT_1927330 [Suillus lakei]
MQSTLPTVARGIAFEQRPLQLLQQCFSMSLKCVSGKSGSGIDLLGWWWLPIISNFQTAPITLPPERKRFSPNYVRDMEGVWLKPAPLPDPPCPCLNWVQWPSSQSQISLPQRSPMHSLPASPVISCTYLLISPDPCVETILGEVGSACWNPALGGAEGLLCRELDVRWKRDPGGGAGDLVCCVMTRKWTPDTHGECINTLEGINRW